VSIVIKKPVNKIIAGSIAASAVSMLVFMLVELFMFSKQISMFF
jgi:hypothetical protein